MCRSRKAFKLSTKFFDNRKTKIILDMENGSKMVVIWLKLLALAGQNDFNGALYITDDIPYTPNELSNVLHEQVEDILKALYVFEKYSMILVDDEGVITIKNWEKYQNEDEDEDCEEYEDGSEAEEDEWLIRKRVLAAERKRRQRAREKDCEDDVTLMSRSCHADVTQESVTCHARVTQESSSSPTPPLTQRTPIYINNNILTTQEDEKVDSEEKKRIEKCFEKFWDAYANKKGKKNAHRAFLRISPNEDLFQKIMDGVERYHRSRTWVQGYRKEPATWLNGECWNDEYDEESEARRSADYRGNRAGDHSTPRTVYDLKPQFAGHRYDADGNDITDS